MIFSNEICSPGNLDTLLFTLSIILRVILSEADLSVLSRWLSIISSQVVWYSWYSVSFDVRETFLCRVWSNSLSHTIHDVLNPYPILRSRLLISFEQCEVSAFWTSRRPICLRYPTVVRFIRADRLSSYYRVTPRAALVVLVLEGNAPSLSCSKDGFD